MGRHQRGEGGHPVVFIHGGLADHRAVLFRFAPLAATHRLIAPDLRASGRSHDAGELSWDRLADDLARLLGCLDIERALRPLFEALPLPARDLALEMLQSFDPASVAATTRFLASGAQPMSTARELEAIAVPVLVLPGIDEQHPAEIGELYARHLRHGVVFEQTAPDVTARLAAFCADPWARRQT